MIGQRLEAEDAHRSDYMLLVYRRSTYVYRCASSSAGQVNPNSAGCIHSELPVPGDWELWTPV